MADGRCTVCLGDFQSGDELIYLPCRELHCYHAECVVEWLKTNPKCPACGQPITPEVLEGRPITEEMVREHYVRLKRSQPSTA